MDFCYSAILRRDIPLVQHCPKSGNFDLFFQKLMEKNKFPIGRSIVISEGYLWGIQIEENSLIFLCVLNQGSNHDAIQIALDDLRTRFLRFHSNDWENASPYAFQSSFEPQIILIKQSLISMYNNVSKPEPEKIPDDILFSPSEDFNDFSEINNTSDDTALLGSMSIQPKVIKNNTFLGIAKKVMFVLLALLLLYAILVAFCGGFDLRPSCVN